MSLGASQNEATGSAVPRIYKSWQFIVYCPLALCNTGNASVLSPVDNKRSMVKQVYDNLKENILTEEWIQYSLVDAYITIQS